MSPDSLQNTAVYSELLILRVSTSTTTILASILPIGSIFALYFIANMVTRLVAVALFTIIFACSLSLATGGRPIDVFSATAA